MTRRPLYLLLLGLALCCLALLPQKTTSASGPPTPPDMFIAISPPSVFVGGSGTGSTAVLTYTVENFNDLGFQITGVAFTHSFPAGQQLTGTPVASNTCGGTLTAAPGGSSVSLSGGTVAFGPGNCQVKVNLQVTTLGDHV